jgi:hypothetical protein
MTRSLLLGLGLLHGTWAWHRVRALEALGALAPASTAATAAHTLRQARQATLQRLRRVYLLLAVPGSLLLLGSGVLLVHQGVGWVGALQQPWLLAMLGVTLLEFSEGITITRSHLDSALQGRSAQRDWAPHLDLPLFVAVLVLGLWRPVGWWPVLAVLGVALAAAAASAMWAFRKPSVTATPGRPTAPPMAGR